MKFLKNIALALLILTGLAHGPESKAQFLTVDTTAYIEWSDNLYLSWKDFRFRKQKSKEERGLALTSVTHSIRGGIFNDEPRFEVKVLFVKKDSWTTDSTSIALLAHEKLHFDIAELYGRKIRKQISELHKRGERDLKVYNKYVRQLLADFKRFSLNYDKETGHGRDSERQNEWFELVFSELERLKQYSQ
ncbi:DUF922 domain-containing protein [Roseivirga sp. UBA838]|uniref:DUF922 domain-containing protein n=1 Tax=Roseivirga sp. UBA838 TaxID=1947393 RepID=UPI00257E0449|nr:DUF922 domain-containing protein [Roseivirga sp. UBA838]|tara:strand:+ start:1302 stop:1871 length:570 start_codon:yes stop_codon:yes gene_type:complete